jgi:hypothetical protein
LDSGHRNITDFDPDCRRGGCSGPDGCKSCAAASVGSLQWGWHTGGAAAPSHPNGSSRSSDDYLSGQNPRPLETIQYTVEKVITAETGQGVFGPLFGDRLLFVAHGYVIAGIDMKKLLPDDLRVDDGILYVELPPAEIFMSTLDNEKSYVYDRETGIFTQGDVNLETLARQAAEDEIREAALEDGILEQAQVNAEAYLYRLLRSLGFLDVIFEEPISE